MQAIGEMFGSPLKNLDTVCHGVATTIRITEQHEIFKDCPPEFKAGRYHSWVIDEKKISKDLLVTAVDEKGRVMAIKHRALPISGVQFHPESILSEHGETIIKNWIYN